MWKKWWKHGINVWFMYLFKEGYNLLTDPHVSDVLSATIFCPFSGTEAWVRTIYSLSLFPLYFATFCFYINFSTSFFHISTCSLEFPAFPLRFFFLCVNWKYTQKQMETHLMWLWMVLFLLEQNPDVLVSLRLSLANTSYNGFSETLADHNCSAAEHWLS